MERSQSCTQFTQVAAAPTTTTTATTTITTKSVESIRTTTTTTTTAMQLRTLQQKSASGSNLNVKQTPSTSVANTYALLPLQLPLNNSLNAINLRRKRKLLQRQQSHEYADDDMDFEYAADHEDADADEDDADMDLDGELSTIKSNESLLQPIVDVIKKPQRAQLQPLTLKKHMQFQRRKPQSSNSLLLNAMSCTNSLPCIQPQASSTLCGTPPPSNYYRDRQRKLKHEDSFDSSSSAGIMSLGSPVTPHRQYSLLKRDNSIHSDSSRYSSVDSLLEARKPDPEAILINLGFGPLGSEDILSRIPKRFLKPSQVPGNDTEAFVRRLQLASSLADQRVLGYRGLTGNPDVPPSSIVAKIMHRFEVNERKKSMASIEHTIQ